MMFAQHFLKQGLQVGPWRVTRKVLLFIVAFCVVVLAFGGLMLETHAFDADCYDDDDDGSYERYDDDDDDECFFGSGDMVMMVLMAFAGIGIVVSLLACCFAEVNPPSHLESRGGEQVFTIQLTKPSIGPHHPEALSHYQNYHLQQQQQFEQQYRLQLQQQQAHQHQQQQQIPQQQMFQQQSPQHQMSQQQSPQHQMSQQQSPQHQTSQQVSQQQTPQQQLSVPPVQRSSSRPNHRPPRDATRQQRPASQGPRMVRSPPPPYSPPAADLPSDNPPPYSP